VNRAKVARVPQRNYRQKVVKEEAGYSLAEVLASIVILSIAIIPMVGMFDAGLKAASIGGNYDKARTLANLVLEQAKSLPYEEVRDGFPAASTAPGGSGSYADPSWRSYTGPNSEDFAGFEYKVDKRYLERLPADPGSPAMEFNGTAGDDGLIKLTVTARWGENKTYSTTGVVANGTP